MTRRRLNINPEPIKTVPAAVREAWAPPAPQWRCWHVDGRGQCTSRETRGYWNEAEHRAESYCVKHYPEEAR